MRNLTAAERLARIETLLEEKVVPEISSIRSEIKAIKDAVDADVKDLDGLKKRGGGMLVGVGLAASAFGASMATHWKDFLQSLH